MKIIDITGSIENGMWSYGDPIGVPSIEEVASVAGPAGWQAHSLALWTLTGTYLESSAHLFVDGESMEAVDPERFIRPASIVALPPCPPRHAITSAELEAAGVVPEPGAAVLVSTGWDRMWNTPRYVADSPYMTMDAMQWIIGMGASIIGGDFPTFDNHANPAGVNQVLFKAGCLLLAPLVGLQAGLTLRAPELIVLPLRIKGVCGTPCRAILVER